MTKENKNNSLTRSMKLKNNVIFRGQSSSLGATTTSMSMSETSIILIYNKDQGPKFYWDEQLPFDFSPSESSDSDKKYYYRSDGVVTSIPSFQVPGCDDLIEFRISNSVTSIGFASFFRCPNLTSVRIPDSVTNIQRSAFAECGSLNTVIFTQNSRLETIEKYAFSGCAALTSIIIPRSVTDIQFLAFESSVKNVYMTFPQKISNSLFTNASSNVDFFGATVTTVDYVKYIILFYNTDMSPSFTWGGTTYTFYDISASGDYSYRSGVTTKVPSNQVPGSDNLIGVTIGNLITSIGGSSFTSCKSLTTVTFTPNSTLVSIDDYAFAGCVALKPSITIPSSVTSIGKGAFEACFALKTVYIKFPQTISGILFQNASWPVDFFGKEVETKLAPLLLIETNS